MKMHCHKINLLKSQIEIRGRNMYKKAFILTHPKVLHLPLEFARMKLIKATAKNSLYVKLIIFLCDEIID
jgi:hypothetical protein